MVERHDLILGAGFTGLAAATVSAFAVLEARNVPGGICSTYYQCPDSSITLDRPPPNRHAYRFELGGGHWIFGGTPEVNARLDALARFGVYNRRAAVFFPESGALIPYPLQYNLNKLPGPIAEQILSEMKANAERPIPTSTVLSSWLEHSFGPTLMKLFFGPFHESYTAGLWTSIGAQDLYKSPVDLTLVERGVRLKIGASGYNSAFRYPRDGLGELARALARGSEILYSSTVARIDLQARCLELDDGRVFHYDRLISTLPLNRMIALTGLQVGAPPDPFTSLLVLNIGGARGPNCPDMHWVYVAQSRSGFFRVGFYSNVDKRFLPVPKADRVALYVERSYAFGRKPSSDELNSYQNAVVRELQEWGFLKDVDALSYTWVDVAYTWSLPRSTWRNEALERLEEEGVMMAGRFARWRFQGIADSVGEGLRAGRQVNAIRPSA